MAYEDEPSSAGLVQGSWSDLKAGNGQRILALTAGNLLKEGPVRPTPYVIENGAAAVLLDRERVGQIIDAVTGSAPSGTYRPQVAIGPAWEIEDLDFDSQKLITTVVGGASPLVEAAFPSRPDGIYELNGTDSRVVIEAMEGCNIRLVVGGTGQALTRSRDNAKNVYQLTLVQDVWSVSPAAACGRADSIR